MGITYWPNGIGVGKAPRTWDNVGGRYTGGLPVIADLGTPVAADDDAIIDAATSTEMPNATTKTYTIANIGTSPCDGASTTWILDVPRNVSLNVTHSSSIVAVTVVVSGYDEYGVAMSESLSVTATGTDKTTAGKKAFKSVTSVAITSAGNSTTDTLNLGWGDVLGLPYVMAYNTVLAEIEDAAAATAGTVVVAVTTDPATTTTGDVRGTYDPNSACGSAHFRLVYIPTDLATRGITQA